MNCCLCVDADWAHPEVTAHTLEMLERRGVAFTFFATEEQIVPTSPNCEIAWHPNFERGTARVELARLQKRYPGKCGIRPHRLAWGDCNSEILKEYGLCWTSSTYRPHEYQPLRDAELTEVSISWGDNWWFIKKLSPDFDIMQSNKPGIYVLNVHPIHVFLNTTTLEQYEQAKEYYRDPDALRAFRDHETDGVSRVFERILDTACVYPKRFMTISDAIKEFTFCPS